MERTNEEPTEYLEIEIRTSSRFGPQPDDYSTDIYHLFYNGSRLFRFPGYLPGFDILAHATILSFGDLSYDEMLEKITKSGVKGTCEYNSKDNYFTIFQGDLYFFKKPLSFDKTEKVEIFKDYVHNRIGIRGGYDWFAPIGLFEAKGILYDYMGEDLYETLSGKLVRKIGPAQSLVSINGRMYHSAKGKIFDTLEDKILMEVEDQLAEVIEHKKVPHVFMKETSINIATLEKIPLENAKEAPVSIDGNLYFPNNYSGLVIRRSEEGNKIIFERSDFISSGLIDTDWFNIDKIKLKKVNADLFNKKKIKEHTE